jgi:hypothetical protein
MEYLGNDNMYMDLPYNIFNDIESKDEIIKTYEKLLKECENNYKALIDLTVTLVLEADNNYYNKKLYNLYKQLSYASMEYAEKHLAKDEAYYYYSVIENL